LTLTLTLPPSFMGRCTLLEAALVFELLPECEPRRRSCRCCWCCCMLPTRWSEDGSMYAGKEDGGNPCCPCPCPLLEVDVELEDEGGTWWNRGRAVMGAYCCWWWFGSFPVGNISIGRERKGSTHRGIAVVGDAEGNPSPSTLLHSMEASGLAPGDRTSRPWSSS
jgi:hypothetical protein